MYHYMAGSFAISVFCTSGALMTLGSTTLRCTLGFVCDNKAFQSSQLASGTSTFRAKHHAVPAVTVLLTGAYSH